MKALKLSIIAFVALLAASCGSKTEEQTTTEIESTETENIDEPVATGEPVVEVVEETPEQAKSNSAEVDALLDEYEKYMDQTIKLAKKAQAGDLTVMTEYPSLLEKAESLSNKLEKFEGDMTPAQAARFQKIAAKAAQAAM